MSFVPCKKNDAGGYVFYISLVSQDNTKIMQVNPTLHADDFKIAVDDGAPGAMDTTPVIDADFTRRVKVVLSQAETNGDNLTFICSDAVGDEWCDLTFNIQTSAQTLDEMDTNIDDIETDVTAIHGTDLPAVKAETALIVEDTNAIQGKLPTNKFMGSSDGADDDGTLNAITAAGPSLAEMDTAHALLATPAEVASEIADALKTDTLAETIQGIPSATPTIEEAMMLIYTMIRNKKTISTTELGVYNDAGTKIHKKALADAAGTYTEDEMISGV